MVHYLGTTAFVIVPDAVLSYFRDRLLHRDAKYVDLADHYVAREVDVERLTAEYWSVRNWKLC